MLVGKDTIAADTPEAIVGLRARSMMRPSRGMGQDPSVDGTYIGSPDYSGGVDSTALSIPEISTPSSGFNWGAFSNIFSSLANNATRAFASTQTQCSIGTTQVGNQCLPTSTVNALALQSQMSANPAAYVTSTMGSYLPLLLGAGALIFIMSMKK